MPKIRNGIGNPRMMRGGPSSVGRYGTGVGYGTAISGQPKPGENNHNIWLHIGDCIYNCGDNDQGTNSDNAEWRSSCMGACVKAVMDGPTY